MQETRQHILEILRERNQATVDEIVADLQKRRGAITAVTVRHHLLRLQQETLITEPILLHRTTPGRPQHVYMLTEKAKEFFPHNYQRLVVGLLEQIQKNLSPPEVNVILEGVADQMAMEAQIPDIPLIERVKLAVNYLNENGYKAWWEDAAEGGFILHTSNCPYHHAAASVKSLCDMDMRLVASLMGVVPRLLSRVSAGDNTCSYFISSKQ